jgi:pyruvate/2-oxoglutarate dehydrogenase complex dihydrolipoamide dehydrogenase (E3) component
MLQVEGRSGENVRLRVRTPQGERTIEGSDILVATGRTPNTSGIGLDIAAVRLDGRGFIQVNERLETSAPGVWAIGECAGTPQFTHVSPLASDSAAPSAPAVPCGRGERFLLDRVVAVGPGDVHEATFQGQSEFATKH